MKMLVVDDSTFIRKSICKIVSTAKPDWEVDAAGDGTEALSMIESQHYDLVTVDYNMPGIDGGTVILNIKEKSPKTKVALLTANRQQTTQSKADDMGVTFIAKPNFKDALLEFIKTA